MREREKETGDCVCFYVNLRIVDLFYFYIWEMFDVLVTNDYFGRFNWTEIDNNNNNN